MTSRQWLDIARGDPIQRLQTLESLVVTWADEKLPKRKPQAALLKLTEEVGELIKDPAKPGEYADIVIMLLDLAAMHGVNIYQAVVDKMAINIDRKWELLPSGIMQHVEPETGWPPDVLAFINNMLDPEMFGHAVTAEIRDEARRLLGMKSPVESQPICSLCRGSGKINAHHVDDECPRCDGTRKEPMPKQSRGYKVN